MNRQERIAWFNLTVMGLALLVFLILMPVLGPKRATGAFGLTGLMGLPAILALRKQRRDEVVEDERDQSIRLKSTVVGYSVFWVYFVGACMVPYSLRGQQGMISVEVLPIILMGGFLVLMLSGAIATIVQYHWGRRNAHG